MVGGVKGRGGVTVIQILIEKGQNQKGNTSLCFTVKPRPLTQPPWSKWIWGHPLTLADCVTYGDL